MKRPSLALAMIWVAALVLLPGELLASGWGVGFQASLDPPISFISSYDETSTEYSAAMRPLTTPLLNRKLRRQPMAVRSSSEDSSITFNTVYHTRRQKKFEMIPVTVDVQEYYVYRSMKRSRELFRRQLVRSYTDPNRGQNRRGFGAHVGLPKRLDGVFGEGGADLRVSGYRRIIFSGTSTWTDAARTDTHEQSQFPALNMEQQSRFDIHGTIGSKVSVKVTQDSQTDIPLANRIQIRYKGDEDDILKTIEAGNTNLSLPNTKFVGYSSRIQGLFGIKTEARVGALTVTAIASQEQGSAEAASFNATGEQVAAFKRDYDYAEGRIYDLGDVGIEFDTAAGDTVTELIIYEQESRSEVEGFRNANLYKNPSAQDTTGGADARRDVRVVLVDPSKYTFINDRRERVPYVHFSAARRSNKTVGIYMIVSDTLGSVDTIGAIPDEGPISLLLLADNSADAESGLDKRPWKFMWRNCYNIDRGATIDNLRLNIFKGPAGTERDVDNLDYQESETKSQPYLQITGLDQVNSQGIGGPDGQVDSDDRVFRPDWGLLVFPDRTPFNTDRTYGTGADQTMSLDSLAPDIYDYDSQSDKTKGTVYYIRMVSQTRDNHISLNRANIIEGSERVTVNGRQLKKGTGYNIQYDFGRVTLLDDEASDPNADVRIEYEYAPFFTLQKKTLLGMRAEYERSKDFKVGATMLFKTDKAQDRKPRVGEETTRMVVYDMDMRANLHPDFLTDLADALPLVTTEAPSNLRLEAEIAQSYPNPNIDGVAYVDDFESTLDQLSLGLDRSSWHHASRPFRIVDTDTHEPGKLLWHTPDDLPVVGDVWANRDAAVGQGTVRIMRLKYRPQNFITVAPPLNTPPDSVEYPDWIRTDPTMTDTTWAGIMRYFSSRVDADRAQLFEVRMKFDPDKIRGRMHFDFGRIPEDLDMYGPPDGLAFTEDTDQNRRIDEDEDTGLDGLHDEDEPAHHSVFNPDPNGDNWYFDNQGECPLPTNLPGLSCGTMGDSLKYYWLNGTEGNIDDAGFLGMPDQEKLSVSGSISQVNDYFSFSIDFDNIDTLTYYTRLQLVGSQHNGWWTYQIPIRDSMYQQIVSDQDSLPSWSNITHVRVWFEAPPGQTEWTDLDIAEWHFVQMNWQDSIALSPDPGREFNNEHTGEFVVSSIGEDNSNFRPPEGVEAYEDPTTSVVETQRGLLLKFDDLPPFDTCIATKSLFRAERFGGYRRMEMFVHADEVDQQRTRLFFRLGRDGGNYYEYGTKLHPGVLWDSRNSINLSFEEITALKDEAIRGLGEGGRRSDIDITDSSHTDYWLRVRGDPNLNQITYFAVGVINNDTLDSDYQTISGSIWLDELRLTEVRRDVGTAGRVAVNGSIADLFTYSFSLESKDPYFRGLTESSRGGAANNLGSGQTETSVSYNMALNLHKFLPPSWGASIPIRYSVSKNTQTPLLRTGTDIVLAEEVRYRERSISESKQFSISESFNKTGRNPLFSLLLNRLKTSFSYRRGVQTSPARPYTFSENQSVSSKFNFGLTKVPTAPIFFFTEPIPILRRLSGSRLSLYPASWNASSDISRSVSISDDTKAKRTSSIKRNLSANMSISYNMFENLTSQFNVSTRRDLSDLDQVNLSLGNLKLGLETNFNQSLSLSYDPRLLGFLTTGFSFSGKYNDRYDQTNKTRTSQMSRSQGVSGRFNHMQLLTPGRGGGSRPVRGREERARRGGAEKKTKSKKPFYDPPLAVMRFLTGWIRPVSYGYTENYDNTVPGMLNRPVWQYRFGFERETDVELGGSGTRTRTAKEGKSFDLGSGFTLLGGLVTDIKFNRSISRDLVKQGQRTKSTNTVWPGLTISIKQFDKLPIIKPLVNKFVDVFAPKTNFSRTFRKSEDLDKGFIISESEAVSQSPLLGLHFKVLKNLSLSASYSKSQDNSWKYNSVTGNLSTETRSTSSNVSLTTGYRFSSVAGIPIPVLGRLKFTSDLSVDLKVRFQENLVESSNAGQPFAVNTDKSERTYDTSLRYQFSKAIQGRASLMWQDSNDRFNRTASHRRRVEIVLEIKF